MVCVGVIPDVDMSELWRDGGIGAEADGRHRQLGVNRYVGSQLTWALAREAGPLWLGFQTQNNLTTMSVPLKHAHNIINRRVKSIRPLIPPQILQEDIPL